MTDSNSLAVAICKTADALQNAVQCQQQQMSNALETIKNMQATANSTLDMVVSKFTAASAEAQAEHSCSIELLANKFTDAIASQQAGHKELDEVHRRTIEQQKLIVDMLKTLHPQK